MASIAFVNARVCRDGQLISGQSFSVDKDSGFIIDDVQASSETVDLRGAIVAPGFLELQTNGMKGFHFTHFQDDISYVDKLQEAAVYLPSTGVTAFWATIPTVASDKFKQILPALSPRTFPDGASLLGAHAEGPYLHISKKGAHNASLFFTPRIGPEQVYGPVAKDNSTLKLVTLAPELPETEALVKDLVGKSIRVSLGHSNATYDQGLAIVQAGATCLTHTLNAMAPMHHRDPGLAGIIGRRPNAPYYSIIPDGNHLHPSVVSMLFHANPEKCILVTDSIELAGLPDGNYPGHAQVPFGQTKVGSKVVIEGTNTLIGSCVALDECVRNLVRWSRCSIAEAVRCVTANIADFMGETILGRLEPGRRGDFVVLDEEANVLQTYIGGRKVWERL